MDFIKISMPKEGDIETKLGKLANKRKNKGSVGYSAV
jgi:hypothetical protein